METENFFPNYRKNAHPYGCTLKEYCKENETILTPRKSIIKIRQFLMNNTVTQYDAYIFQKICNSPDILSKLVWVNDGSYLGNRIFYKRFDFDHMNYNALSIEFYAQASDTANRLFFNLDTFNRLNFLTSFCNKIFIHLIDDKEALQEGNAFEYSFDDDMPPISSRVDPDNKKKN